MKKIALISMLAGCCAGYALAQDSVSNLGSGLPGDALDPYSTDTQCASYTVELSPFKGSLGTSFMIAPILKSSKTSTTYFSSQTSAFSLSHTLVEAPFASSSYATWASPGEGVNPTNNAAPAYISAPTGNSLQFAAILSEFGDSFNGVAGAVANIDPTDPNTLYVTRIQAVTNGFSSAENRSQLGIGAVNAQADMLFRADDYGATGPNLISGNNVFQVNLLDRDCSVVNVVDAAGLSDAAAGNQLVTNSSAVHNTMNISPSNVTDGWKYLGSNFNTQYVYGDPNGVVSTGAHLTGSDQRGAVAYMTKSGSCFGGPGGTAAMLSKGPSGETDQIDVWGVELDGSVTADSTFGMLLPTSMVDHCDPSHVFADDTFSPSLTGLLGVFDGYHGTNAFRGGTSLVALQKDPFATNDRLLAAATVYAADDSTWPLNLLTVARTTCVDGVPSTEWGVVAYTALSESQLDTGKTIYNADGVAIGAMEFLFNVTGGTPFGPSISAPAFDAAGNVWFVSAVRLTHYKDGTPREFTDYDSALIRAIYDADNFCYKLELVMELGEVFNSRGTGLKYNLQFMGIANNGGGLSSSSMFSTAAAEQGYLGKTPSPLLPASASNWLGGFVIGVEYAYDVDADNDFDDPTSSGGDANSLDESYNGLLYITADPEFTCGDINCDGSVDAFDIDPFIKALLNPVQYATDYPNCNRATADINGSGNVDAFDIDPFVGAVLGGAGCAW